MGAHYFNLNNKCAGVIHLADIYTFEGYTFEWHHYSAGRSDAERTEHQL